MKHGKEIFSDFLNLEPVSVIPQECTEGDIIYLSGHVDFGTGLFLHCGFTEDGRSKMYPLVLLKEISKYFRKF